mgnify:CR=1 FL=1
MAIKRFIADKDTTITNAYDTYRRETGVSSSMGAADSLQVFSISGSVTTPRDNELSRVLLQFPIDDISDLITNGEIPTGSIVHGPQYFLKMYNVKHDQQTPRQFHLVVKPITTYWEEGNGLDMFNYSDKDSANWVNATDTKTAATYQLDCVADTGGDTGGKYFLLNDANNITYKVWIDVGGGSSEPSVAGTGVSIEVDISSGAANTAIATAIASAVNSHANWTAAVHSGDASLVQFTSSVDGAVPRNTIRSFKGINAGNLEGLTAGSFVAETFRSGSNSTPWTSSGGDYSSDDNYTVYFDKGTEDLELNITTLVQSWLRSSSGLTNYGLALMLTSSLETGSVSYFKKMFSARGSQYFYRRPTLEVRWDDSTQDGRADCYYSSSLADQSGNLNTIYLYNYIGGQLKDIPDLGTGEVYVSLFSGNLGNNTPVSAALKLPQGGGVTGALSQVISGGHVSTGIYSASFAVTGVLSNLSKIYDVWANVGWVNRAQTGYLQFFTGTINMNKRNVTMVNTVPEYTTTISNLRPVYNNSEKTKFRVFVRNKDWNPNLYSIATSKQTHKIVEKAYYKIYRVADNHDVVAYGTGSSVAQSTRNLEYTKLSYDVSGSYFDFDMSLLEKGYSYGISLLFDVGGQKVEQPEKFRFRVE